MKKLPPTETRFQSGHEKQGGREKGTRNKLNKEVIEALRAVWNEPAPSSDEKRGVAALRIMFTEEPAQFARLYAGLLPKEIDLTATNELADVDDGKLDALLAFIDSRIANELGRAQGDAREGAGGEDQTPRRH